MTTVMMGQTTLELDSPQLGRLRDANDLLGNRDALLARLDEDGYLWVRGLHDREQVRKARDVVLDHLADGGSLDPDQPRELGVAAPGGRGGLMSKRPNVVGHPDYLAVVEGDPVMDFFRTLLGGDVLTFSYKWLRAVAPGDNTGAHYDIVYMGRGTENLYTCWTPMCDLTFDMGPLAVLVGSHRFEQLKATYGRTDVDRDKTEGWYSRHPLAVVEEFGGQWQTAEFEMGDAMIFGMFTMHGSLNNTSNRFRISCDTRYQRADEPADPRWIGADPLGHEADHRAGRAKQV